MEQVLNRLLIAVASLVVNLGARHLPGGLSPQLQALTTSNGMRMLVVCAMFYLSTRDGMLSIALAFVFFVAISTVLNERSGYSIMRRPLPLSRGVMPLVGPTPLPLNGTIHQDVYDRAVDTVLRFRRQARVQPSAFKLPHAVGHP